MADPKPQDNRDNPRSNAPPDDQEAPAARAHGEQGVTSSTVVCSIGACCNVPHLATCKRYLARKTTALPRSCSSHVCGWCSDASIDADADAIEAAAQYDDDSSDPTMWSADLVVPWLQIVGNGAPKALHSRWRGLDGAELTCLTLRELERRVGRGVGTMIAHMAWQTMVPGAQFATTVPPPNALLARCPFRLALTLPPACALSQRSPMKTTALTVTGEVT